MADLFDTIAAGASPSQPQTAQPSATGDLFDQIAGSVRPAPAAPPAPARPTNDGGYPVAPPFTRDQAIRPGEGANIIAGAQIDNAVRPSAGERFVYGLRDPGKAGAQLVTRGYGALTGDTGPRDSMDRRIKDEEATYQQRREASGQSGADIMRALGTMTTTAPLMAAAPAAGGPLSGAVIGGVTGAAGGALEPVTDTDNFWRQKGVQTGTGALGGAALGGGTGLASSLIGPRLPQSTITLRDAGVRQTPGQTIGPNAARFESALESTPVLGNAIRNAKAANLEDFNRALVANTLGQIGEELPAGVATGRAAIAHSGERISAAYDDVLPRITGQVDQPFLRDMQGAWRLASMLPEAQRDQFTRIVSDRLMRRIDPATGQIPGTEIQAARSDIMRLAQDYMSSADGDHRILGRSLADVGGSLMGLAERADPALAGRIQDINRAYSMQLRLENAAGRAGTAVRDGMFTPAQLDAAVRGMATTNRQYARGNANMQDIATAAVQGLGDRLPNSGTADRQMAAAMLNPMNWPAAAAMGLASLPYTRTGQAVANGLIAGGAGVRTPIGNGLRYAAPFASGGGGLLGGQALLPLLP